MGFSLSPSSPFLSIDNRSGLRRCDLPIFGYSNPIVNFYISRHRRVCLSASVTERRMEASWLTPEGNASDDYGGWAVIETQVEKKKGSPTFLLASIGTSIAIALMAIAHFSLARNGFKFKFVTLQDLQGILKPSTSVSDASPVVSQGETEPSFDETSETTASVSVEKLKRIVIPVAADSVQQEALLVLKKLKIIEGDVKGNELCTRREYARWLVKANSVLERNLKHRIIPSLLLAGPLVGAFDDVNDKDPDFWYIQALAEAGIIPSKLSGKNNFSGQDGLKSQGSNVFLPQSFITRMDLINWRAQVEYSSIAELEEKMSMTQVGFMDLREIGPEASPEFYMDMLASEKSILRKVFGQTKRLQPSKPATKAQAAVALTSGRMEEAIRNELSRLETESLSREAETEEIKSELLGRGEIQKYWEGKLNEEKGRGFEVERDFLAASHDLEQEKIVREKSLAEHLKEKTALDCQTQLLLGLKEEINEMSGRLASEKASFMVEQRTLEDMRIDLQAKQEAMLDAKSVLEAEKEALQILRSWIEDEARKNRARANVLAEVGRRWRWDDRS